MEHESFENPGIAQMLNEHFVAVKVDREERPDIDRVYMAFVQGTTGSGGWPMSVWLTPELAVLRRHLPHRPRSGIDPVYRSAPAVEPRVERESRPHRGIGTVGDRAARGTVPAASSNDAGSRRAFARIASQFRGAFDARYAGFGGGPKFPRPAELLFLLREHVRTGKRDAKEMVLSTPARWRSAACAITSAAASTATRSMRRACAALREDALRPGPADARAYLERCPGVWRHVPPRCGRGHLALRHARDDRPGWRLLLG